MAINYVTIAGNLARDLELKVTKTGYPIGNFTVAVNERRKNSQTDEWEDHPHFFDCVLLGARAEKLAPYMAKGLKVAVAGKLQQQRWETEEGQKRSKVEILVNDIELMARSDKAQAKPAADIYDDEIPF